MKNIVALATALTLTALAATGAEREVSINNQATGITLAGSLSMPEGVDTPRGVVVMITGSGAQDRDEEVMGLKPFRVLSDSLVNGGWATLRVDDRGTGASTGDFATATQEDFITDAKAVFDYADSLYSALPVGLLGHSEGGQIAYRLARQEPRVDFIVTLAAPAWEGDSIIMSQSRALAVGLTGRWDAEPVQRQLLDIVKGRMPNLYARIALTDILNRQAGDAATLPAVQQQISASVEQLLTPWYRAFIRYNPAEDIAGVTTPWLAVNGEKDTQALPGNLTTISELNPRVQTVLLPGMNHLFQKSATGLVNEYPTAGEVMTAPLSTVVLRFLDTVGR